MTYVCKNVSQAEGDRIVADVLRLIQLVQNESVDRSRRLHPSNPESTSIRVHPLDAPFVLKGGA